jgi:hypothetical protein
MSAVRKAEGKSTAVAELGGELAEVRAVVAQRDAELTVANKKAHAACTACFGLKMGPYVLPDGTQGRVGRGRGLQV